MSYQKFLPVLFFVLYTWLPGAAPACEDTDFAFVSVFTGPADDDFKNFFSCEDLIDAYNFFCHKDATIKMQPSQTVVHTRDLCCETCEAKSIPEDVCADKPVRIWTTSNGQTNGPFNCQNVPLWVCENDEYKDSTCCYSCAARVTPAPPPTTPPPTTPPPTTPPPTTPPPTTTTPPPTTPPPTTARPGGTCVDEDRTWVVATDVNGGRATFQTCEDLTNSYEGYCRQDATLILNGVTYRTRDKCCASCEDIDPDVCADIQVVIGYSNKKYLCPDLVSAFNGLCLDFTGNQIPQLCCGSCAAINLDCVDVVSKFTYSGIGVTNRDCAWSVNRWPGLCKHGDISANLFGLKDQCCDTCKDVDTSCVNDPFYSFELQWPNGNGRGKFRHCLQLGSPTSNFRRRVCCSGWLGNSILGQKPTVAEACCDKCKDIVC